MTKAQLGIDWAKPGAERASIHVVLPNNTQLTVYGDTEIVAQIVKRIDGMEIVWTERKDKKYE